MLTRLPIRFYHLSVAVRKVKNAPVSAKGGRKKNSSAGRTGKPPSPAVLFWLAFAILIFGLFLFNREAINNSIETMRNELSARKTPPGTNPLPEPIDQDEQLSSDSAPVQQTQQQSTPQTAPTVTPQAAATAEKSTPPPERQQQPAQTPSRTTPQNSQDRQARQSPQSRQSPETVRSTQATQSTQAGQRPEAVRSTAELRERALYFTQVDRSGSILRVKVNRRLPVSDSPMLDVIQALVAGPNAEEKQKGLISLIPPGTRILSATVRGNTAYINFSEDFQYNTYGVEGYAGQLRQIVFTVTEFPNVNDVQILIESRRVDYLGEGIWIGSPLSREML